MIFEYFRITGTNESILEFSDVMSMTLRGDDVQGIDTKSDEVHLSLKETLDENIPESICQTRLRDSEQLKTAFALYSLNTVKKL